MTQNEARRRILSAWRALPPALREIEERRESFVLDAADRYPFRTRGLRYAAVRQWLEGNGPLHAA